MDSDFPETLPPEQELALAYTPREIRAKFRAFLAFDQRLARIVAGTSEPMLGQMRLAWWREQLSLPITERPDGDVALAALGEQWAGDEEALTSVINAHELMVALEQLRSEDVERYVAGRSEPHRHLLPFQNEAVAHAVLTAARLYICVDAATRLSDPAEREVFVEHGRILAEGTARLPRALRGLGVLQALALRSLKNGGRPLMEGRGAALTALRAAMLGR